MLSKMSGDFLSDDFLVSLMSPEDFLCEDVEDALDAATDASVSSSEL